VEYLGVTGTPSFANDQKVSECGAYAFARLEPKSSDDERIVVANNGFGCVDTWVGEWTN
jgi:hypothetical protein